MSLFFKREGEPLEKKRLADLNGITDFCRGFLHLLLAVLPVSFFPFVLPRSPDGFGRSLLHSASLRRRVLLLGDRAFILGFPAALFPHRKPQKIAFRARSPIRLPLFPPDPCRQFDERFSSFRAPSARAKKQVDLNFSETPLHARGVFYLVAKPMPSCLGASAVSILPNFSSYFFRLSARAARILFM